MNNLHIIGILLSAAIVSTLVGCVTTEESGAGDRARSPVQILGSADSGRHVVRQDPVRSTSVAAGRSNNRLAPKFDSQQDTLRASVVTRPKSSLRAASLQRSEHSSFTVQIGAYTRVSNALRAQKSAKRRFADEPVFNKFVRETKVYRVSVGRYENRKDAFALYDAMKKKYPMEYNQCWVNYIP